MWDDLRKRVIGLTSEEREAEEERRYARQRKRAADEREDRVAEAKAAEEAARLNAGTSKHQAERQLWDRLRDAPLQEQPYIAGIAADTAAELKRRERGEARPLPPPAPLPAGLNPKTLALKAALKLVKLPPEQRMPMLSQLAEELMQMDGPLAAAVLEEIPAALQSLGHDPVIRAVPAPAAPPAPEPVAAPPRPAPPPEPYNHFLASVSRPPMPFDPLDPKTVLTEVLMERKPDAPVVAVPGELKRTSPVYQLAPWSAGQKPHYLVLGTYADGNSQEPVTLPLGIFAHHAVVVGASGTGKTRFITLVLAEHLAAGASALVTDAKDQTLQELATFAQLPPEDVAAFLPRYRDLPGWNPFLEAGSVNEIANSVAEVFSALYSSSWGQRLDSLLKNSLFVLAAHQRSVYEVPEFLSEARFREQLLAGLREHRFDEEDLAAWIQVERYFRKEYGNWKDEKQAEALSPLMNKIIGFLKERFFVQSLCSLTNTVSLSELWERQLLVLAHLDFDKRPESAKLFGGFLARRLFAATENRRGQRPVVFVADEVDQTEKAVGDKLREVLARKRSAGIQMILGTQHLSQLSGELKSSVLANCKVQVFFRLGPEDARPVAANLDRVDPYTDAKTWESRLLNLPRAIALSMSPACRRAR